jgi:hypothetical protein
MSTKYAEFELGASIKFSGPFTDPDGVAFTPPGATLYLTYKKSGALVDETHAMTMAGASAFYLWDSSAAAPGLVSWYAETTGPIKANKSGAFTLVAAPANPNA